MLSSTRTFALSAALLAAVASALQVNTPTALIQCQPVQLSWQQGTAPYYVSIIPGGDPSGAALETFDTQSGTTLTWMVDISAGQSVTVKIVDSTGETNYSDKVTIQAGSSTTCSSSAGASSSDATSAADSSSGSSSTKVSASRTALSGSSTSKSSSSSASSASDGVANAASSPSASSNTTGAASTSAKAGLGLLLGGLVMALAA